MLCHVTRICTYIRQPSIVPKLLVHDILPGRQMCSSQLPQAKYPARLAHRMSRSSWNQLFSVLILQLRLHLILWKSHQEASIAPLKSLFWDLAPGSMVQIGSLWYGATVNWNHFVFSQRIGPAKGCFFLELKV